MEENFNVLWKKTDTSHTCTIQGFPILNIRRLEWWWKKKPRQRALIRYLTSCNIFMAGTRVGTCPSNVES
ncbi:CLUMA_CG009499, isoform A [Clunio marinus]|uniref:CLUMA_CG009499, isoform A n=1 Tax=Clunio marinus TaxID=568069 RepID=A0A1J1IAS2_9DIPT|nr:CLUMA_CG009499, isoform A [Clunio marinus]